MRVNTRKDKGQTALETAFVFSMLLFLAFTIVNLGILLHTRTVATYAAFMAARSFQVYGDTTSADTFQERGGGTLVSDVPVATANRVAEDIFTCSLPWMSVPKDDAFDPNALKAADALKNFSTRCAEGKRKYKNLNIGGGLKFDSFKQNSGGSGDKVNFEPATGGFSESGREPLRYGILEMQYRPTQALVDPFGVFKVPASSLFIPSVLVPVLLNPGLQAELKKDDKKDQKVTDIFK